MEIDLKTFIPKWVEALESGKYNQTEGCLKREEEDGSFSFCCLGVAAEILDLPVEVTKSLEISHAGSVNNLAYEKLDNFISSNATNTYIEMNDTGNSFKEIAAAIRKDFHAYFESV